MDQDFHRKITSFIQEKRKVKSIEKLMEELICRQSIYNHMNDQAEFTVSSIRDLIKSIKVPFITVENLVTEIGIRKTARNPKIPFKLHTEAGARLRAVLLSEVYLPTVIGRSIELKVPELEIHGMMKKDFLGTIGNYPFETSSYKWGRAYITRFPAILASISKLAGVPSGDKCLVNPFVPKDIMLGGKGIKREYLRWAFASEGTVCRGTSLVRCVDVTRVLPANFVDELGVGKKNTNRKSTEGCFNKR